MGCGCQDKRKNIVNAVSKGNYRQAAGHVASGAALLASNTVKGAKAKLPFKRG